MSLNWIGITSRISKLETRHINNHDTKQTTLNKIPQYIIQDIKTTLSECSEKKQEWREMYCLSHGSVNVLWQGSLVPKRATNCFEWSFWIYTTLASTRALHGTGGYKGPSSKNLLVKKSTQYHKLPMGSIPIHCWIPPTINTFQLHIIFHPLSLCQKSPQSSIKRQQWNSPVPLTAVVYMSLFVCHYCDDTMSYIPLFFSKPNIVYSRALYPVLSRMFDWNFWRRTNKCNDDRLQTCHIFTMDKIETWNKWVA